MVSALYRRYRPETFSELIGQSHVTDPLMAALRSDRVNHAYLFSGPRGCGKTTSARILARCLNCAKGPTDTPCGECDSCIELGRDGGGSIDVIEIDAASHGGVDDARDLRERATLAPNRDRYKIYIIDEAHMVSKDGFNALLKIVEEPPEHVKFIFATTEPEKVIGTIRSRTHHYPFRLIPPAMLLEYVTQLSNQEGVEIEPGVLPLVIRAGGGSARDTLSLLDQLMAGSEGAVTYERAVSLLGFTHAELLDDVTAALAAKDSQGAFNAVERVMQTGQDPRRFVEDLLEHLRDLIIAAVTEDAESILHGVQAEDIERMRDRAHDFGPARLSVAADTVAKSLSSMSGATSPKLQLELLLARLLVTGDSLPVAAPRETRARASASETAVPDNGRANRGSSQPGAASAATAEPEQRDEPASSAPTPEASASDSRPDLAAAAASFRASAPAPNSSAPSAERQPVSPAPNTPSAEPSASQRGAPEAADAESPATPKAVPVETEPTSVPAPTEDVAEPESSSDSDAETVERPTVAAQQDSGAGQPTRAPAQPVDADFKQSQAAQPETNRATTEATDAQQEQGTGVSFAQIEDAWPEVLGALESRSRRAWMVASAMRPVDYDAETNKIGVVFRSQGDMQEFRAGRDGEEMIWKIIRSALNQRFGQEFGFTPRDGGFSPTTQPSAAPEQREPSAPEPQDSQTQADAATSVSAASNSNAAPDSSSVSNSNAAPENTASEYGSYEPPESYPEPGLPPEDPYASGEGSGAAYTAPEPTRPSAPVNQPPASSRQPAPPAAQRTQTGSQPPMKSSGSGGWAVAQIPQSEPAKDDSVPDPWAEAMPNATVTVDERHDSRARSQQPSTMAEAIKDAPPPREPKELSASESARYGEAVIREELGAEFIEEITEDGGF